LVERNLAKVEVASSSLVSRSNTFSGRIPDLRAERDAIIAATALVRGTMNVTRNVADFEPTGAPVINPWE
jgi:predicted nucleic acid-binding protein